MKKTLWICLFLVFAVFASAPAFSATTYTVTSIEDSGPGTLREALGLCSAGDMIDFNTSGNSITVYSTLTIPLRITLGGSSTQVIGGLPGNILFDVGSAAVGTYIQNLATVDAYTGFNIHDTNSVVIVDCAIGTDFSDSTGRGHVYAGVRLENTYGILIGQSGHGNVISGNGNYGIYVLSSYDNSIQANYLGMASDGATPLPNGTAAVYFYTNVWQSRIGGDMSTGEGNVISGNSGIGIALASATTQGNTVCGNVIGLTAAGVAGPGNGDRGIAIIGGQGNWIGLPTADYGNYISGNTDGIYMSAANGNVIQNNIIGLDGSGNIDGNTYGIYFQDGTNNRIGGNRGTGFLERNVISGQVSYDVYVRDAAIGNSICGNYIGTSVDGSAARDNGAQGLYLTGSGNLIGGPNTGSSVKYGNVLSGHNSTGRNGIAIAGGGFGNTVVGNTIGLDAAGTSAVPNYYGVQVTNSTTHGNLIGSSDPDYRNMISGNSLEGIRVYETSNHTIIGNYIGLNMSGDNAVENGPSASSSAIHLLYGTDIRIGGTAAGEGNYISGSTSGINLGSTSNGGSNGNTIVGNYIGVHTDLSVSSDPPLNGLYISSSQEDYIGIAATGQGNLIANCTNGIRVASTAVQIYMYGNTICANTVHIQLLTSGTTGNNGKASPTITGPYDTYIGGTAEAYDFVEVFKAENVTGADGSLSYVGSTTADGSGNWTLNSPSVSVGDYVVATATDLTNGTSQLSTNALIGEGPTATPTWTPSATPTSSPTVTVTPTISATYTVTPVVTATPTSTSTPTVTPTTDNPLVNADLHGKNAIAYPNPGKDEIRFLVHLDAAQDVVIRIYNMSGEQVAQLESAMHAGHGQTVVWDCRDVAPGIYVARVFFGGQEKEKLKIAVVK